MEIPEGHEYCIHATYYKVGLHEYIYMWNNGEWVRSSKTMNDLNPKVKVNKGQGQRRSAIIKKEEVMKAINQYGKVKLKTLFEVTGISPSSVNYALKDLRKKGNIVLKDGWYFAPVEIQADLFFKSQAI